MLYAIVAVVILILDQAVKYWTNTSIAMNAAEEFIPGFISLTNIHNSGAAWGFMKDVDAARWIFVVLTVVLCAVIIFILARKIIKSKLACWMLLMIMAGGIGNCIDRVINGYVVDMFRFAFWESFPVFNVADIFVTVSGVIFCLWLVFNKSEGSGKPAEENGGRTRRPSGTEQRTANRSGYVQGRGVAPESPAQRRPAAAQAPVRNDYITQLKRPVTQTKAAMETQAASAQRAEDFSKWNVPNIDGGRPAVTRADTAAGSSFEEFFAKSAPASRPAAAPARRPAAPTPGPAAAPAQRPAAPAPKIGGEDFSLEDILAEFSDK